jgi:glycosyltransferase involved in cell wall biosynthesis
MVQLFRNEELKTVSAFNHCGSNPRVSRRQKQDLSQPDSGWPLVSVITAVLNGRDCVGRCIESVRSQDYPNFEHLVLDGGSKDGTVDILRENEESLALWVSEPDSGVYDAWNKGLRLARGEWIAFLGADDMYLPGAIMTYMELARANPEAEFLTSRARLDHPTGYAPVFGGPWQWPRFATQMTTIHVGTMHRRSLFDRIGAFDTSFRIAGDYEFLLRSREGLHSAFTSTVTVVTRAGGLSDSTAVLREALRAKLLTGVCSPLHAHIQMRRSALRFHLRRQYLKVRGWFVRQQNRPTSDVRSS